MFELDEIIRERESKMFAEILNRLREGNHTPCDIQKLKERCVEENECPIEAPWLFIQNALVDEYIMTKFIMNHLIVPIST